MDLQKKKIRILVITALLVFILIFIIMWQKDLIGINTREVYTRESLQQKFINNLTDKKVNDILYSIDCLRASYGFENIDELSNSDIFNLYASTDEVQEKMRADFNADYVEIPVDNIKSFVKKHFDNYPFDIERLASECNGALKYDSQKQIIYLSTVNGGVIWPGGLDSASVINSVSQKGDLVIINAKRHWSDHVGTVDVYDNVTITLKPTNDGFNYVSFLSENAKKYIFSYSYPTLGISLKFPNYWAGRFIVDKTTNSVMFYQKAAKQTHPNFGKLFTIYKEPSELNFINDTNRTILLEANGYRYIFDKPSDVQYSTSPEDAGILRVYHRMELDIPEIKESFKLINNPSLQAELPKKSESKPLTDDEVKFENGVKFLMTFEEVKKITGDNIIMYNSAFEENKTFYKDGVTYGFSKVIVDNTKYEKFKNDGNFYLFSMNIQNNRGEKNLPAKVFRDIRIGDTIESVLNKFPTGNIDPQKPSAGFLYGTEGNFKEPRSSLEKVADSYYVMGIFTESYNIHITFSRLEQKILWIELSVN